MQTSLSLFQHLNDLIIVFRPMRKRTIRAVLHFFPVFFKIMEFFSYLSQKIRRSKLIQQCREKGFHPSASVYVILIANMFIFDCIIRFHAI